MATSKIKGLQIWCQKMAEGYARVDISNFTTAWRNGLAFCAIIHRFRPDLIDFDSLSPDNVFENCKMAFEVAERELGIPAFLEAEDMERLKVPDKLSIITYVSQYYNYLHSLPQLGGPGVKSKVSAKNVTGTKRPTDSETYQAPITKKAATESKENSAPATERETSIGDKCGICQNHVYLLERHMDGGKLYHRSCFRHSELSPANKVLTRSPFLSPSLSFDTKGSASTSSENKPSSHSGTEMGNKIITNTKQTEAQPSKTHSETPSNFKKADGIGLKHTLDEPGREDIKKSKMQPKSLFDNKSKPASTMKERFDSLPVEYSSNNVNSESEKSLQNSNKEVQNKQEKIVAEKSRELAKSTLHNILLKNQQKDISSYDTAKTMETSVPATPATRSTVDAKSTAARGTTSTTSNTTLTSHPEPNVQSKYKLAGDKDNKKTLDDNKTDKILPNANVLPSVQNLQKMFSGQSNLESSEPLKPVQPVARPRSGTLKTVIEESKDAQPKKPAFGAPEEKQSDSTPKPAPRRSLVEISEKTVPHTQDLSSTQSGFPPPLPTSAPPPFSISVPSGEINSATDINVKRPSVDRLLQETKASLHPANKNIANSNTSHNLHKHYDYDKTATQGNIKLKPTGNSNNINVSIQTNVKHLTETGNRATTASNFTSNRKVPTKNDDEVQTGLLSSLVGVRSQINSSPGPNNHTLHVPANTSTSTLSSDIKVKTETISSSKTPVNKTVIATNTPPAQSLHSISLTNTSSTSKAVQDSKKKMNIGGFHSKSNTEKNVVIQGQNHSTVSVKTFPSIQTVNKDTDNKQNQPEKINNSSKSALTQNIEVHNNEPIRSKQPSQNMNQNIDVKVAGKNILNLNDNEKKLDYKDAKSNSKQSSSNLATPNHSISNDESKSLSSNRNKSLSSSKEDILNINSIKLRTVMPQRKEVEEPKTTLYDVKLKKVDVIKGDTKWDSTPQKPQRSQNISETNKQDAGCDSFVNGDQRKDPESLKGVAQKSSVLSNLSMGNSQKTGIPGELQQQKKDFEEKKIVMRSEYEINQVKHLTGADGMKAVKLDINVDQASKDKISETKHGSIGLLSVLKKSGDKEKDIMKNIETKRTDRKLSPIGESHGNANKLDWQIEAEKRRAALAGFDMEVTEKLKEPEKPNTVSSDMAISQQTKMVTKLDRSEADVTVNNNKTILSARKYNGDRMMSGDNNVEKKGNVNTVFQNTTVKSKESSLEFVLNKTKLKAVEVDIITEPEDESEKHNDQHAKLSKSEDFRNILYHLKHVTIAENSAVKTSNGIAQQPETTTDDIITSPLTKSVLNNNKNNNNKPTMSDPSIISAVEDVHKLNKNGQAPLKTLTDENENKNKNSDPHTEKIVLVSKSKKNKKEDKVARTSPKAKKKISFFGGKNKGNVISPPSSPKNKKKLQVTKKFDFDKSSDFEHSLVESTAKLDIQGARTPSPSGSNNVVLTPNHISAIELQSQLQYIDTRLTELELRGRKLEESIRKVNSLEDDEDQLMIEWFSLINEKNDLVRKEANLVYLSREQDLETEQERIESQLRYLMGKPDECKSPEEKQEEDYLLKHKLTLVEQRDKIVDSMDQDRIRYEDEDRGIEATLKNKGLWKDSTGTLRALKGKKVSKSVFYT